MGLCNYKEYIANEETCRELLHNILLTNSIKRPKCEEKTFGSLE